MKTLILLPILLWAMAANATNYYVSSSGNDANNGTSNLTPWRTLNRVNSYFNSFRPGDNILLNRGDVFYGSVTVSKSGTSGSPITIGAYGTGTKPIITGFTSITAWTNLGSNIWESSNTVSDLPYTNMVVVNGKNTSMGRYPNTGLLIYQSHSSQNQITSNGLDGSTNWTGAELALFVTPYSIGRNLITAQGGGTLIFNNDPSDGTISMDNQGFFIQNDARTLDMQNEWYYNPYTKKLRMYSTSMPISVQISTVDTVLYIADNNYVTIDNISFQGSNTVSVLVRNSKNITIQNCDFTYAGRDAVFGPYWGNSTMLKVQYCNFNNSNNAAINISGDFDNAYILSNNVKNSGKIGMGATERTTENGLATHSGILCGGAGTVVKNNIVSNSGYLGIRIYGDNSQVVNNLIDTACTFLHDGGGIYISGYLGSPMKNFSGIKITGNIVLNVPNDNGIYTDDRSNGIEISGNTMFNCSRGLYLHNNWGMNIFNNTAYNNLTGLQINYEDIAVTMQNVNIYKNIFLSKLITQQSAFFWPVERIISSSNLSLDSNYYARPVDDNKLIQLQIENPTYSLNTHSLSEWQAYSSRDVNSKKSPKTITDVNDLRFEYNATTSDKTISLDARYIDVTGKSYSGTITLAPYSSVVLIRDGTVSNQPPKANAGSDKTITLPVNTVSLLGNGTDSDGIITSYVWAKIAGPVSGTMIKPDSASTIVSGLTEGVYQFELKVTDDKGAAGRDTVQVTVNAAANIPPTANAGANKTITLPTSTVSLSGSGSDTDGTISNYLWTKNSGPSAYNIVNAGSPVTDVTGLVEGIYQFQLKVTDNKGATATSTVQVTVNTAPAANISPIANAGANKTITLPTNSTSLSGSGSDADGTISNYLWTKTSGPSVFNIVNAGSPVTDVTGLVEGIYQFQLQVTDNKGATATSTMQVTVNAAPAANIPPTASAGENKTITLPINSTSLSGSGTDVDGIISSYLWTKTSGPSKFKIASVSSPVTDIKGLEKGVYQFELKVTDDKGATATSTVQVTVNAATNTPPKANAGANKKITLPTSTTSLAGSGSDTDGMITNYRWTKTSGPSTYNIVNAESPVTDVTGLQEGVYQFELEVIDDSGSVDRSTVEVTVSPAANIAPVANAGAYKTITLPTNSTSLAGSGSDADGLVSNYLWAKTSGPSAYNIVNAGSPVTDVTGLEEGVYQFELKVTDNQGATATSIVQITVNAAPSENIPPIANAGADVTITLPVNSVNLSGNGMDADGTIAKYQWKQISGPSGASITADDKAGTSVTNLTGGTYEFEFTVTDNKGATGKDTMVLVVALGRMSSQESNGLKVYPNPVRDIATVGINTAAVNTNLVLTISDMNGRVIYKKVFQSTQNVTTEKINMTNFAKGTYMVTVIFDEASKQTFKIIKL